MCAYVAYTPIQFGGLRGQTSVDGAYDGVAAYRSDVYVFCVQTAQSKEAYDAFAPIASLLAAVQTALTAPDGCSSLCVRLSRLRRANTQTHAC